ncbi:MAG TPA: universal stress protein [Burkholderiales bacterium]|nr:universal stress protein [Burkholderiales bacterium]
MYKHILIPTDGSNLSIKAVKQGVAFAKAAGARVTAITVTPSFHMVLTAEPLMVTDTAEQYKKDSKARAKAILEAARKVAASARVRFEGVHAIGDQPFKAIINAAQRKHCDLIFMASHGWKGFAALVLGSETNKVLTHSRIPVLVYR